MINGFIKSAAATPEIIVADCVTNADRILNIINEAEQAKIKLLCLPELCITGYTCGDLFLQKTLIHSAEKQVERIIKKTKDKDIIFVLGAPVNFLNTLYNCAVIIYRGKVLGIVPKSNLPGYGGHMENRYFSPAPEKNSVINYFGQECLFGKHIIFACKSMPEFTFAAEICEDLWVSDSPSINHALNGAAIILNPSAGGEVVSKADYRRNLISMQSAKLVCGYIYANAGDGESTTDEVFSGHNVISENGTVLSEAALFENGIISSEIDVFRLSDERRKTGFGGKNDSYDFIYFDMKPEEAEITRKFPAMPFVPENEKACAARCSDILLIQAHGLKKRLVCSYSKTAVVGISGGLDSCLALLVTVKAFDLLNRSRKDILAVTMPCFGTTSRTKSNAEKLCERLGVSFKEINISKSVTAHFEDIGHDINDFSVTYENAQARERTQVLMDVANKVGGMVIGTGDLSELALGWATYNGDHMSMYGVNASVPKTLIRYIVKYYGDTSDDAELKAVLYDILDTPVSPELLPADEDNISQKTEDIVGPYTLHDFYLYYGIRCGFSPSKIYRIAKLTFKDMYSDEIILKWLKNFYKRFFAQQFKRSCLPDGPKVGSLTLSPRGDWKMPSDASASLWLKEIDTL